MLLRAALLSEEECRARLVIPFRFQDERVVVAVGDPTNDAMFEKFSVIGGRTTVFVVAARTKICAAIAGHFQNRTFVHRDGNGAFAQAPLAHVTVAPPEPSQAPRLEVTTRIAMSPSPAF